VRRRANEWLVRVGLLVSAGLALGSVACTRIIDADKYSVAPDMAITRVDPTGSAMGGTGGTGMLPPINPMTGGAGGSPTGPTPPEARPLPTMETCATNPMRAGCEQPPTEPPMDAPAPPMPGQPQCPNPRVSFDTLFQLIAADLTAADIDDRRFFRYVSLTNRFTAGVCLADLTVDRQGLFKLLNMLSGEAAIALPEALNADQTLYRIDLRRFGWERAITVNGTRHTDVWEAIASANDYAIPFVGDDADDANAASGSAVPLMFADHMLDVASIGNLYYAIIGVDTTQRLSNFIAEGLQIDLAQNLLDEETLRAGTTRSRITRVDVMVQRDQLGIREGVLWQSFEFAANQSIFENPLAFASAGRQVIFTLPNGMLAFLIADATDTLVEDSDILLDTNQNNFRAITSVSCANCHAQGILPVVDEVRDVVLANATMFDQPTVAQVQAVFAAPADFARVAGADSQDYQRALQAAALPTTGGDPVSGVFLRFDQDMVLADAAGDLGVTPDELADNLNLLDPVLAVLSTGSLDRDDFTQFYLDSLCKLSLALENAPDQNLCDLAALGIPL
jgi:hypothetical protein